MVSFQFHLRCLGHGIGRFDDDEIARIGKEDIMAISAYLGEKQFFFGDTPTLVLTYIIYILLV